MAEEISTKTFTTTEEKDVITIQTQGGDDASLKWAITDKVKTAPVSVTETSAGIKVTTRDRAAASEVCSLLQAQGYRPG